MEYARASRLAYQLPEDSRIMRKLEPSNAWSWKEVLLNRIEHALRVLIWQNTEDATKQNPQHYPEQWYPSFIPKPEKPKANPDQETMDIDDLKSFLSRPRENAKV